MQIGGRRLKHSVISLFAAAQQRDLRASWQDGCAGSDSVGKRCVYRQLLPLRESETFQQGRNICRT